jgi:hypothetical protein
MQWRFPFGGRPEGASPAPLRGGRQTETKLLFYSAAPLV